MHELLREWTALPATQPRLLPIVATDCAVVRMLHAVAKSAGPIVAPWPDGSARYPLRPCARFLGTSPRAWLRPIGTSNARMVRRLPPVVIHDIGGLLLFAQIGGVVSRRATR
jgi:hypothetical protein